MHCTCTGCRRIFAGIGAFDKHRIGGYGEPVYNDKGRVVRYSPPTRRCMSDAEMAKAGLEFNGKMWSLPIDEDRMEQLRSLRPRRMQSTIEVDA